MRRHVTSDASSFPPHTRFTTVARLLVVSLTFSLILAMTGMFAGCCDRRSAAALAAIWSPHAAEQCGARHPRSPGVNLAVQAQP